MSAQHTPGPLIVETLSGPKLTATYHQLLAMVGKYPSTVAVIQEWEEVPDFFPDRLADARRFVACWNACEDITTDELEEIAATGGMLGPREDVARIATQRDELLAALNMLKAWDFGAAVVTAEDEKRMDGVAAFARSAIAKAGGEP